VKQRSPVVVNAKDAINYTGKGSIDPRQVDARSAVGQDTVACLEKSVA